MATAKQHKAASINRIPQPNNVILNQLFLSAISQKVFSFLTDKPKSLTTLSSVCFQWNNEIITGSNSAWEIVCRYKWKYISSKAHPNSWQMFYRKRIQILKQRIGRGSTATDNIPIENCAKGLNLILLTVTDKSESNSNSDIEARPSDSKLPEGMQWKFEWYIKPVFHTKSQQTNKFNYFLLFLVLFL